MRCSGWGFPCICPLTASAPEALWSETMLTPEAPQAYRKSQSQIPVHLISGQWLGWLSARRWLALPSIGLSQCLGRTDDIAGLSVGKDADAFDALNLP